MLESLFDKHILVVDDHLELREALAEQLAGYGCRASRAQDGQSGIELARTARPDAILLDLSLPDFAGSEVLRVLGGEVGTRSIPVIIMSVRHGADEVTRAFELGARDYVRKPFDAEEVVCRLRRVLSPTNAMAVDSMVVQPVFHARRFSLQEKSCFLVMPFGEDWSDTVWTGIRDIVQGAGWSCVRAEQSSTGAAVIEDIWIAINQAKFVVAEVTSRNPNVWYELGIAHTLGKRVVLVAQEKPEDLAFDIRHHRVTRYRNQIDGLRAVAERLQAEMRLRVAE